jgi:hypothetical protein
MFRDLSFHLGVHHQFHNIGVHTHAKTEPGILRRPPTPPGGNDGLGVIAFPSVFRRGRGEDGRKPPQRFFN